VRALLAAALLLMPLPALAADNEVMAADRAFSALSVEKGVPYAFWFCSSATTRQYGEHGGPQIGRAAAAPKQVHDTVNVLSWAPTAGAVSSDGKMGWTDGAWKQVTPKGTTSGHYVTVWVKQDGAWKMQVDIGNTDLKAP
jgi:uncharacterized protein DUF4440